MLDEIRERLADPALADTALHELTTSRADLTADALWVLTHLWYDLGETELVTSAVTNAQAKLPVIEVAIIATSVLYGAHLILTKGVKRTFRKVEYHPDGSFTETTSTEYFPPASPIRMRPRPEDPTPPGR